MTTERTNGTSLYCDFIWVEKPKKAQHILEISKQTVSPSDNNDALNFIWEPKKPAPQPVDGRDSHSASHSGPCHVQHLVCQFVLRTPGVTPEKYSVYKNTNISAILDDARLQFPMSVAQYELIWAILTKKKQEFEAAISSKE